MNEELNLNKLKRIHGLPIVSNGMTSNRINVDNIRLNDVSKWHMSHKPYQCDYSSELIRR